VNIPTRIAADNFENFRSRAFQDLVALNHYLQPGVLKRGADCLLAN
jgi:hypothetical protein